MSIPRWTRIEQLFDKALALSGDEQAAFLAQIEHEEVSLGREVRALVDAHRRTGILDSDRAPTGPPDAPDDLLARVTRAVRARYVVEEEVGSGGMAFVFRALDVKHDRPVALKVLRPDVASLLGSERFLSEILITARLQHPRILPLFDSGEAGGFLFYVMPLVTGRSLRERMEEAGPLPVPDVLRIVDAVAAALDYAHQQGIVHRDIKPENILLQADEPVVGDFGIALAVAAAGGERVTRPGLALGTPSYMSPEQAAGDQDLDARSDVYALACVTYELLAGRPPFAGSTLQEIVLGHITAPVPPLPRAGTHADAELDMVMARALAKSPPDRFRTPGELAGALAKVLTPTGEAAVHGPVPSAVNISQDIHFCTARDGVRIAYATMGDGPPLVKASNWLSHLEFDLRSPIWQHWWAALSRRRKFVRYDERGCGLSERNVADMSFDAWVADLEAVVDDAGLDRFALLGVSQGGPIAIAYAVRHPERVSHLVLHGTYCRGTLAGSPSDERVRAVEMELDMVRLGWGQDTPAFRQAFTTIFFPDATPEQAHWFNELQRVTASPEEAAAIVRTARNLDVRDLAGQVTAPTLVLHCDRETRVPFEDGRYVAGLIPGARFVALDSRNHLPLEHEPAWQRVVEEVDAFLETSATARAQ